MRGQVTIFVIMGLVLIVGIIGFIYFSGGIKPQKLIEENPQEFMKSCVEDAVENSIEVILENGGQIQMSSSTMHLGETYNYLCYSGDYFKPCYNLHPLLQYLIESEIKEDTIDDVQRCFDTIREELEDKGYSVTGEGAVYSIDLLPGIVQVNLDKKIIISRGGSLQNFEDFGSQISSPLYGMVQVTNDIINDETINCKFDHYYYMRLNSGYHIKKINFDESRYYLVKDRQTEDIFKFAVRNCVLPPGL